ncbi:hypothetical protein BDN72DRAFT_959122 [Pluteus cervinus]|uniref:Uncharacterized protein n=1 Tax=Pluteus cervinus TaxID=181527 RepID=A0ACD3AWA0_9AGAR|nr:hypothetical protein BDN72DRAFT_959122 [Pluteus cervinus]
MKLSTAYIALISYAAVAFAAPPAEPAPADILAAKTAALAELDAHSPLEELAPSSVTGTINASALKYLLCPRTTGCTAMGQYSRGTVVTIQCRTNVNTSSVEGWPWWDKLANGYWAADYYIDWTGGTPPIC